MSIVNSIKTLFPGFGNVTEYQSILAQALTRSATVSPAFTGFSNPVRSGRVRIKTVVPVIASTQVTAIKITGTDGTTTVTLYQDALSRTASENLDLMFDFLTDLGLTTVTIAITNAAGGASDSTADLEFAGNP